MNKVHRLSAPQSQLAAVFEADNKPPSELGQIFLAENQAWEGCIGETGRGGRTKQRPEPRAVILNNEIRASIDLI
jgi:hypothetical protein